MRVLQLCGDRGIAPGSTKGAAQHLRGIAAGLVHLGHELECYTARPAVGDFPVPVRPISELVDRLDNSPAVDLIYERYSMGHDTGRRLARSLGVPFVLEVNAPLCDEAAQHRPDSLLPHHRVVERDLLVQADLVVTVSTDLQKWVKRVRSGPVVTVFNGFEPLWFAHPDPTSGGRVRLGFIGHPKPWHGADRLLDLLVSLGHRGFDPELMIIGGGPGADDLAARADRLGLFDQVIITGARPPAVASGLLTTCDIGLAPYRFQDPFYFCPLKVIDYLAAGVPIVASAIGDIPELVADAGFTVPPDDDDAIADAVQRLILDPSLRRRLGAAGRTRAMDSLTWQSATEATLAAIEDLTGQLV